MKVSMLITSFNRETQLQLGLESIVKQNIPNLEMLVINDGVPDNSEHIARHYGAKYFFTGQRNEKEILWRCPSIPLNIAAKHSTGDILILTCAEIFHIDSCLDSLLDPFKKGDDWALPIPDGRDDTKNVFQGDVDITKWDQLSPLNTELPFLMGVHRSRFFAIGGYDEDFSEGYGYDDNDIIDRLQRYGCHYVKTSARCIHLYHPRSGNGRGRNGGLVRNQQMFESRKGIIVRNVGKEWGIG